MKKKFSFKQT